MNNDNLNEFNQNTRTLIVSFVVAIMALIPLRFVEVGNGMPLSQPMVLGETVDSQVVLPNANVNQVVFESPYNEEIKQVLGVSTETTPSCIARADADKIYEEYALMLESNLNEMQKQSVVDEVLRVEKSVCR